MDAPYLYRSLVFGAVCGLYRLIEGFEKQEIDIEKMIAVGGISKKSPYVMQMLSDLSLSLIHISTTDTEGDTAKTMTAAEDVLTADDDLAAFFCINDMGALGCVQAAQAAGKDDILIYGVDAVSYTHLFFIFMGIKMATDGVLRGLGIMRPFLIANMVNLAIRLSVALIFAPRFGIEFVWLAVPAGWFANFLISYVALRRSSSL